MSANSNSAPTLSVRQWVEHCMCMATHVLNLNWNENYKFENKFFYYVNFSLHLEKHLFN